MTTSTLGQVLTFFEQTDAPLSLAQIARELEVPPARLEGMIQHWVRRGRLREVVAQENCGTCGVKGQCPFIMELPHAYELATNEDLIPLEAVTVPCDSGCGCS
jgi:hypothetical protein